MKMTFVFVSVPLVLNLNENHYSERSVVFRLNPEYVICGSLFSLMSAVLASNW